MPDVLNVIMRWLHISSMAALVGGILYARLVMTPASASLEPGPRETLNDKTAAAYRPIVVAAMISSIVSGLYRFLTNPGHKPLYHTLFGIKMLLVLHVFAVAMLVGQPRNPRRTRQMTGIVISGLVIILISAWLRENY